MPTLDYLRQSRARERAPHLTSTIERLRDVWSHTSHKRTADYIAGLIVSLEHYLYSTDGYRDLTPEYSATLTEVE